MHVISRVLVLSILLAVCANSAAVQVIESDSDGLWNHSAKKLRAMATVYLAEFGDVPRSENNVLGVSLSASGSVKSSIRMEKFLRYGRIEEDSVVVASIDNVDDAVESMLKKSFETSSKVYKIEKPAEVFFMEPEFIDVDDSIAIFANKKTKATLDELGYELCKNQDGAKLQMFLIRLKDAYWLGMIRIEGSKIIKGVHKKYMPDEDLETIIYSLMNKVMDPDVTPKGTATKVVDYANTHEAKCRATGSASSVDGFFAGLAADLLCYMSDYLGLEIAAGSKDFYGNWYPNMRFDFTWGFSDYHAWLIGLDYAGTFGQTKSRWAFESIHRFSQKKGAFVDLIWGWGHDREYEGWYMGGDIGFNLVASESKAHWLSLMLRYDWAFGESWTEESRISINLVYNLRGYFSD
jgi:hypothetical protein